LFSFTHRAYQLRYFGEFNQIIRNYDVVLDGALVNPTLNNFFGFGNETEVDSARDNPFYRVRYSYISGDVLLRRRLYKNKLSIAVGPSAFYYWNKTSKNIDKVLFDPDIIGLDSTNVYQTKFYGGGKLQLSYNTLNNRLLPTRGVDFSTEFSSLTALNVASFPITKLTSSMSIFAPLNQKEKFVAVLHLGGGHIFSEEFEYFQALNLGANNYMRGYRKNRFSGSSMLYGSLELRMKLLETKSYILPGDLGLIGFNDIGRVWMKNEHSNKWHHSYGGGLYYTPFDLLMISATVGLSEEGTLFNIGLGTRLNIVF
jgi:outer membrane protein assembly factor BamA